MQSAASGALHAARQRTPTGAIPPAVDCAVPLGAEELYRALHDIVTLTSQGVAGCDSVSVTLSVDDRAHTAAATAVHVEDLSTDCRWPAVGDAALTVGIRSVLSLPLNVDEVVCGSLNIYASSPGAFGPPALQSASALSRQAQIAVGYLQSLHAERAARARDHQVAGDWYDVLPLPDGAIGVAIGDVMGHDIAAAAAMGQLRSVLRSYAWEGHSPSSVLERLDRLVQGLDMAQLATAIYGRLVLDGGGATFRYANAGHLPPVVVAPTGATRVLDSTHAPLIGAPLLEPHSWGEGATSLAPGSILLLFTDGLVEDRQRPLEDGLRRLREVAAAHHPADGPDVLCDAIIEALVGSARHDDDIALLCIQLAHHRQEAES